MKKEIREKELKKGGHSERRRRVEERGSRLKKKSEGRERVNGKGR